MENTNNLDQFEDNLDDEFDQSLEELKNQLKMISLGGDNDENIDLSDLSEKLGMDLESFINNLNSHENSSMINNLIAQEDSEISTNLELSYTKIHEKAVDPFYNYSGDSCFDLYSIVDYELFPNQRALIPTGLKFNIPDYTELQIRTKSGLAINQGLIVLNSPGTVDSGYIGEIKVILYNTSSEKILIKVGQKIAQACLCPVYSGAVVKLQEKQILQQKERGENGFGSTGI